MKTILPHGLIALTCLLTAHSALAQQTRPVKNTHDNGPDSLREVIRSSTAGDTIVFDDSVRGLIILTNTSGLLIACDLTIIGPGATNLAITAPFFNRTYFYPIISILSNAPLPKVTISGLTITGGSAVGADGTAGTINGAPGQGGGIFNGGNLTLTDCIISGNTATGGNGAGIVNIPLGEGGDGVGGGIYSSGTIAMTNCTLYLNSATGGNGGYFYMPKTGARGSGAGIYLTAGSLVNCTIVSNSAAGGNALGIASGGGVYIAGTNVTIISCTISGNSSGGGSGQSITGPALGGGIYVEGNAAPTLGNTIVAANTVLPTYDPGNPPTGPDVDGTVTDAGFNLIGRTDGSSGWVSSSKHGGPIDGSELDPQLGPLQDNGGPTPTMALGSTSTAIDAGTNFGFNADQRGIPRPFDWVTVTNASGSDGSDIGAYELYPAKHRITISQPPPAALGALYSPVTVSLSIPNDLSPGSTAQAMIPVYTLQSTLALSVSGGWTTYGGVLKTMPGQFVARDTIVPGSAFYRLTIPKDPTAINKIIPPPVTGLANTIRMDSATFTGSLIPAVLNTVYWFEYGTDTNYSQTTQTNSLDTSFNPVDLSLSVAGLAPLTVYHCQLVVMDDFGAQYTQYGGDQQFTTLGLPPRVVANAPTYNNGDCGGCAATAVHLSGTVNAEGSAQPAHAYFEYGTDGVTYTRLPDSSYFTTTYASDEPYYYTLSFTGLLANTTYFYRAIAFNDAGTSTAVNTFTTSP